MSELTQCNYCTLRDIKRQAAHEKKHVHLKHDTGRELDGIDVYVTPVSVDLPEGHITRVSEFHQEYWVSWFMGLTDHCVC